MALSEHAKRHLREAIGNAPNANEIIAALDAATLELGDAISGATVTATTQVVTDTIAERTATAGVTADGVLLKDGQVTGDLIFDTVARTATADGTGTGAIAAAGLIQFVTVTCDDANKIIVLPTPTPGTLVILHVAATGYELRTSDPATIGINGGTGAAAESAIGANVTALLICATATSWKGLQLGADGTLAKVEVAA